MAFNTVGRGLRLDFLQQLLCGFLFGKCDVTAERILQQLSGQVAPSAVPEDDCGKVADLR